MGLEERRQSLSTNMAGDNEAESSAMWTGEIKLMTIIIKSLGFLITSRNDKIFVFVIRFCLSVLSYSIRIGEEESLTCKPTKCLKLSTIDDRKLGYEMSSSDRRKEKL